MKKLILENKIAETREAAKLPPSSFSKETLKAPDTSKMTRLGGGNDKNYFHGEGKMGYLEMKRGKSSMDVIEREFSARDNMVKKAPELKRFLPEMINSHDEKGDAATGYYVEHLNLIAEFKPKYIGQTFGDTKLKKFESEIKKKLFILPEFQESSRRVSFLEQFKNDLGEIQNNKDAIFDSIGELTMVIVTDSTSSLKIIDFALNESHEIMPEEDRKDISKGFDKLKGKINDLIGSM
ncbi:hypothetical protein AKG98_3179 [Moritella sp. JT01]|uniref:hypothetical protein n=1 Tax=Moritella sp. JT01 TaxID=756698 RepID=UPI000799C2D3|nr:hypothetical protein [Moritella sp. JT01]KXO06518.1 hypothetical protein AKG98_3179 [Moritella sp. JT01]